MERIASRLPAPPAALLAALGLAVSLTGCSADPPLPPRPRPVVVDDVANLLGVFEGRIPCIATPLPVMGQPRPYPGAGECQVIKVRLELYRGVATGAVPPRYVLHRIHVGLGDEVQTAKGRWSIVRGVPGNAGALVYELDAAAPAPFRRLLAAGDNVLLFVDRGGHPRVGNASWSFTLSRTL